MNEYELQAKVRRPRAPAKRRRQRMNILPIFVLAFFFFLAAGGFLALRHLQNNEGNVLPVGGLFGGMSEPDEVTEPDETTDSVTSEENSLESAYGLPLISALLSTLTDTGYLKLVNRDLAMSQPIDYAYIVDAWPTVPVRATDITIHITALNAIAAMFEDGQHIAEFFITSGYRSVGRQAEIYENAVDRMYVMPPGHSEHNLGLAADILAPGIPMSSAQMSGTPEAVWLAENAWRYGLVLRYPYGTTHITQVAYEPWHFRYVGRIHAWYITTTGMVLEEYLEFLEVSGGFMVTLEGITYHVIYQQPVDGRLYVPSDLPFNVSASNRGGYIITAWER